MNLHWLGFWIFMSVLCVCDTYLYTRGHDTFLWKHITEAEKEIQKIKIEQMRGKCEPK